jgi:hypothetical protein
MGVGVPNSETVSDTGSSDNGTVPDSGTFTNSGAISDNVTAL